MEHCAHSSRSRSDSGKPGPKPFRLPGHHPRYLPDRIVRNEHIHLKLVPDFKDRSIAGHATLTVVPIVSREVTELELDQRELIIHEVTVKQSDSVVECQYRLTDDKLVINFKRGRGLVPQMSYDIVIGYETSPRWGLHFVGPDADHPERPEQLWTLSQEENSRYWFPCFDHPDIRATLDLFVVAPGSMIALSNGELMSQSQVGGGRRFHWHMEHGLPPYLINLVLGEFAILEDQWNEVPVRYVVPLGRELEARQSLGRTPEMIEFLSNWTDMPYPYKRYDQIVVHDYLFGGMEHTTATTLTERTLRDQSALFDSCSESLVSHELAHQWFGNTVTCLEWSEAWLNEGFATYCENLWMEHAHGSDEARYDMLSSVLSGYLSEASMHYMRPIVERHVHQPIDLFDAHLYEKGAVVLNYLRYFLGDEGFQKSVRRYLKDNVQSSVESHDLMRAVTAETGRRVARFFEQWVFGPGHVVLEADMEWESESQLLTLKAKQTQNLKGVPDCFTVEFDLDICVDGEWQSHRLCMSRREQTFAFALAASPSIVSPDPRAVLPGSLSWSAPESMLCQQLAHEREAVGRVRAARALSSLGSKTAIEALRNALDKDPFWGVAKEAARALGVIRSKRARDALLGSLGSAQHPKTRRAVVKALGQFKGPEIAEALRTVLADEVSIFVTAEAARSLGRTGVESVHKDLVQLLKQRDSWHDVVRAGAITGLASLQRAEESLDTVLDWTKYGRSLDCRLAATKGLRGLVETARCGLRAKARKHLEELAGDSNFRVQLAAISQLGLFGSLEAIACLEQQQQKDVDGRVRRACREALTALTEESALNGRIASLEQQLKGQRSETQSLRNRLTILESLVSKDKQ
jgi:aminopeptidase N